MDDLQQARQLVKAGKIGQARRVLRRSKHPTAKKWLRQLNERYPNYRRWVFVAVVLILLVVVVLWSNAEYQAALEAFR